MLEANFQKNYLVVIVGPTAVGKTELTVNLAKQFDAEVLNADSRQIYKELSIGTARPTHEEMGDIKHYFTGILSLSENYNAGKFEKDALEILYKIYKNKNIAFLSGGSGLYIDAVCKGFDELPTVLPEIRTALETEWKNNGLENLVNELKEKDLAYAQKVDSQNPHRIIRALEIIRSTGKTYSSFRQSNLKERPFKTIKVGLSREREKLYNRINLRMDKMLEAGLVEEAKKYIQYRDCNALQTVGYKEIYDYFDGNYEWDEAVRLLKRNTRRFAKRQMTWFRRDNEISWFHPSQEKEISLYIKENIEKDN
ncbi:tRNA (adenosine(37)-N6)-dimethylallyltransferase MiaA [Chondrinema litorale]|uniref:tRNA (adenosine(37)-N6)-dimethylallyltransferase MiaA n=1 Tax=Chondrinema litorale TaxID=2994555 RepID=UPI002544374A|nr:tRNA (adenosine(37)-N6)-dimethylallyltransferase MiaA [Chondrinema litorale]UZR92631.1 tRNA (adenosine(37)-N6)-dimethylallyltransferase MiaA [Chondrinema litorale]